MKTSPVLVCWTPHTFLPSLRSHPKLNNNQDLQAFLGSPKMNAVFRRFRRLGMIQSAGSWTLVLRNVIGFGNQSPSSQGPTRGVVRYPPSRNGWQPLNTRGTMAHRLLSCQAKDDGTCTKYRKISLDIPNRISENRDIMNIQAKVGMDKQKHPEKYCSAPKCLWRVVTLNYDTQEYVPAPNCGGGRCPRHGGGK